MTCNPTAAMKNTSLKSADNAIRPPFVCVVWYVTAIDASCHKCPALASGAA